jgi:precorrin-2 dehydrogenase/sirohydrochlorin ferrochelatase
LLAFLYCDEVSGERVGVERNRTEDMKSKQIRLPIYYPILLNTQGKRCVVIGGGNVALRKIKILLECRAKVTVISPKPHPDMVKLSKKKALRLIQRDYKAGDLRKVVVVIACTDVKKVNRKVADDAKRAGVLVNVADDLGTSDFILPSFFRRGNLLVAVSTSGMSPSLARRIRTKLEENFGEEYASLLSLIGEVRSTLKNKGYIADAGTWQEALDLDPLVRLIKAGRRKKAKTFLISRLKAYQEE